MEYLYIILIGYAFNFAVEIIWTILTIIVTTGSIIQDPKSMLELKKLESLTARYKLLNKDIPFSKKSTEKIASAFPFASIVGMILLTYKIKQNNGLVGYIESENKRFEEIIKEQKG